MYIRNVYVLLLLEIIMMQNVLLGLVTAVQNCIRINAQVHFLRFPSHFRAKMGKYYMLKEQKKLRGIIHLENYHECFKNLMLSGLKHCTSQNKIMKRNLPSSTNTRKSRRNFARYGPSRNASVQNHSMCRVSHELTSPTPRHQIAVLANHIMCAAPRYVITKLCIIQNKNKVGE